MVLQGNAEELEARGKRNPPSIISNVDPVVVLFIILWCTMFFGGMAMAFGVGQTPMISITMGRAVGGSSLLTGGVCFRIPGDVHSTWERGLGLRVDRGLVQLPQLGQRRGLRGFRRRLKLLEAGIDVDRDQFANQILDRRGRLAHRSNRERGEGGAPALRAASAVNSRAPGSNEAGMVTVMSCSLNGASGWVISHAERRCCR